ncbi:MAG: heme utilization cystosolic carrier protein HutX [Deltaproteobacteria bacterium]|nr:MAG: heme utilization cystosolic carrier protein HutX [Deltaproteobacteria bacterium]
MPAFLAQKLGVPEAVVVAALPDEKRTFVNADKFEEIWTELVQWEKATFIVSSPGAIVEYKGRLPQGSFGRGYFNLMDKDNPLGGHLMISKLASICFLDKQLFGLESLSLQFFDGEGAQMFAVYVGREKKALIPSVKQAWTSLREKYARLGD